MRSALTAVPRALRTAVAERTRWPALDGIRGMAIVAVVVYHAFKLTGGWTSRKIRTDGVDWFWWPLGGGRLGVDLFFVLSGFLLWFSWKGIRGRNPTLARATAEFVKGRAIRIIPPYFVMLAVYVPLFASDLLTSADGVWHLLLFLTIQQYNEPQLPGLFNTPLWTLTVEVQFYVVMPIVAWVMRRTAPVVPLLAALALTLWWVDHRGVYPTSWLPGRADQFVAGMALAAVVAGPGGGLVRLLRTRASAVVLCAAGVAIALYHGSTLGLPRGHRYDEWMHPALGLVLAALVAHLVVTEAPGRVHRWLEGDVPRLFGHLSYGIYLWHFPIYDHVLSWTGGRGEGLASVGAIVGLGLATAITCAAAALSYAWVERPFLERKVRSSISPASEGSASRESDGGRAAGGR